MKKLVGCIFLFILMSSVLARADEGTIKTSLDRTRIPLNDNAVLTVTISGADVQQPEIPKIEGLVAYPSGQSQNIMIINGKMTTSASYTYILQPRRVGIMNIPPIQINQNGKIIQSEPLQMEVTKAVEVTTKSRGKTRTISPQSESVGETQREGNQQNVFIEGQTDKKNVFVGQQVIYTFKFYRSINLMGQPQYEAPQFTNFWVEDLPPEKVYYEIVNGQRYVVSEINMALFPTTTGTLTINPAKLKCQIPSTRSRRNSSSFFDEDPFEFFRSDPFEMFTGQDVLLKTDAIQITVKDFPEQGKPSDFSGVSGNYRIHAEIDKKHVSANQPITLSVELEGSGNIQALPEPKLEMGDAFKFYDSGHSVDVRKDDGIVHGKKIFKKILIPVTDGQLQIPSISVNVFNPDLGSYQTLRSEPMMVQVDKGKETLKLKEDIKNEPKNLVQASQKDIFFIKTDFKQFNNFASFPKMRHLFASVSFPFLLFISSLVISMRRALLIKNKNTIVFRKSYGNSLKKIKVLEREIHKHDQKYFCSKIEKIIMNFLSIKLNIPIQGYHWSMIEDEFRNRGLSDSLKLHLKTILDQTNFLQFAPVQGEKKERIKLIEDVRDLLSEIEKVI